MLKRFWLLVLLQLLQNSGMGAHAIWPCDSSETGKRFEGDKIFQITVNILGWLFQRAQRQESNLYLFSFYTEKSHSGLSHMGIHYSAKCTAGWVLTTPRASSHQHGQCPQRDQMECPFQRGSSMPTLDPMADCTPEAPTPNLHSFIFFSLLVLHSSNTSMLASRLLLKLRC